MGILFQGKPTILSSGPSNVKAKKLDIDFDNDDFFNQFDPSKQVAQKPESPKVEKVKEQKKTVKEFKIESPKAKIVEKESL